MNLIISEGRMMFVSDRQKKINLINKKKQIKTKELCKLFHVSEPTIRADLQYLASLDKLIQVWGLWLQTARTWIILE